MQRAYLEGLEAEKLIGYDETGGTGLPFTGRQAAAGDAVLDINSMITDLETERAKRKQGGG